MSFKPIKYSFLLIIILIVSACGKSTEDEIKDAIRTANIHLSNYECQPAIDALEAMGRQNKDPIYLKVLASAYACRAGYSTIKFFASDIEKTADPDPLGGVTTYTTSVLPETGALANDSKFKDMQAAIDILIYAGGISATTEPSSSERAKYFSLNQAGDINAELAFMSLAHLGRFMKVYANASDTGVKGNGTKTNTCFTDYSTTPVAVQFYVLNVLAGACHSLSDSHTELAVGITERRARLCQGVVLMNTILDILPSIIATAGGGKLDDIKQVTDFINDGKDKLLTAYPTIGPTATVLSQKNCETDSSITLDTLASYYAVIFESLIK